MRITTKAQLGLNATPDSILETLLVSRGFTTPESRAAFLHPEPITPPYLTTHSGLTETVLTSTQAVLDAHLALGTDICIFGDYDADGVTATAVLYLGLSDYLKAKGSRSRLLPFIPDRHRHGYGLSPLAVSEVISGAAFTSSLYPDFHPKLVLTVDTGIVAHAGITSFNQAGIEVILTDHHLPDTTLPPARAIVHSPVTSGAGVAWVFVSHLLGDSTRYLDLATVGIIADMLPLVGFNRTLVTAGLRALTHTKNVGLRALKARMGLPSRPTTTYDVSFGLAPRINAAGRIYSPLDALRLLCTPDPAVATRLASEIDSHNQDRQELTDTALTHAKTQDVSHKVLALIGPYHEGVIGLVAGKLVEQHYRPTLVLSENGEVIKGSARSIPGFNITAFLRGLKTPFLGLGGHEQAAGFSLARQELDAFFHEVATVGDQLVSDDLLVRQEVADLELPLSAATLDLAQLLLTLEPYGLGNTKPRFLFKNLTIVEDRALGSEGKHHKLTVTQGGSTLPLLLFNSKQVHPLQGSLSQCLATLDVNVWNNKATPQLVATYVEA